MAIAERAATDQVAWETGQRRPMAVIAAVAALGTLAGALVSVFVVTRHAPLVGVVQGLTPALRGQPNPRVDPRATELLTLHDRIVPYLISSVLTFVGLVALGFVLRFLFRAARARRPEISPAVGYVALLAPVLAGLVTLGLELAFAAKLGSFVSGTARGYDAVQSTLNARQPTGVAALAALATLAMAIVAVFVSLQAMRVGLLTRFLGTLGIIMGITFVLPTQIGWILEAFWLFSLVALFAGGGPRGMPPAWASGEARPWPNRREVYEQRIAQRNRAEAEAIKARPADSEVAEARASRGAGDADGAEPVRPQRQRAANRRKRRR